MPGFGFSVGSDAFVNLSPERAVSLFRNLLWAEAGRVGIGRHLIDVPECINVGDGGIDAYIEGASPSEQDVIPEGSSVFQIKSSDLGPTACKRELHVAGCLDKPLKAELESRLQAGASYVMVLMADITNPAREDRLDAIRNELCGHGFSDTEVRVYSANQLASFTNSHPALVAALRPELSACIPHERWGSSRDVMHPATFVPDSGRQELIGLIATTMRDRETCPVIRLTGLPGVGKTRSAFESLKSEDLRQQVLYMRSAAAFLQSPLLNILTTDTATSAILVVDECDLEQHRTLTNMLSGQGPRLGLITMSYEEGRVAHSALQLDVKPLEMEAIESILRQEYPGLSIPTIGRLSQFADGFPYIAVLLADQYDDEGISDDITTISDDNLFNRLIGGSAQPDSDYFRMTKTVLSGLSLFHRVGVSGRGEEEGRWLADYLDITWTDFQEIVHRQKERRIIQGDYYALVTPFMLRVHLLDEWWRIRGITNEPEFMEFLESMPEASRTDLYDRFVEHIRYIGRTNRQADFIRTLLEDGGVVSNYQMLDSEFGSRLFLALAEADPETALGTVQRVLGDKSRAELLNFRRGRRNVIQALTYMTVWRNLFQPAAELLLALAEARNGILG